MSNQDNIVINQYLNRLRSQNSNIKNVFLFGSRAKGSGHKWSDYDFCVVSSDLGVDRVAETTKLLLIAADMDEIIEPHPMSIEEFNDPNNDFAKEIKRTGIKIL